MRKGIRKMFVIILILLLLFSITGCEQKTDYVIRSYLMNIHGCRTCSPFELNVDGEGYGPEKWLNNPPKDETIAETKTVIHNGVEYVAKYLTSRRVDTMSFCTDYYHYLGKAEDVEAIEFSYNGDTDELIGFYQYGLYAFRAAEEELPEIDASEEALAEIARRYAADYVDIDDYTLVDSEAEIRDEKQGPRGYIYTFSRLINGRESMDRVQLGISIKGQLYYLMLGDIGIFTQEHEEILAIFAEADIDGMIADTIPEDSDLYIQEVEHLRYGVTPAGQPVLEAVLNLGVCATGEHWIKVTVIFLVEELP